MQVPITVDGSSLTPLTGQCPCDTQIHLPDGVAFDDSTAQRWPVMPKYRSWILPKEEKKPACQPNSFPSTHTRRAGIARGSCSSLISTPAPHIVLVMTGKKREKIHLGFCLLTPHYQPRGRKTAAVVPVLRWPACSAITGTYDTAGIAAAPILRPRALLFFPQISRQVLKTHITSQVLKH